MNADFFNQWLTVFPNFPQIIYEKYEPQILTDFSIYGLGDPAGWQSWWGAVISPPAQGSYRFDGMLLGDVNFQFALGSPSNSRFAVTARWDMNGIIYTSEYDGGTTWHSQPPGAIPGQVQVNGQAQPQHKTGVFDIYFQPQFNLHIYMPYDNRLYGSNFQWNYAVLGVPSSGWQYYIEGDTFIQLPHWFVALTPYLIVAPNASALPYNGANTIAAMHENGWDNPGMDYGKLYEWITYRNAYIENSAQIESKTQLLEATAIASVNSFKQDYADRAQREKNDLDIKKLQILQAIDNEAKSAQRDYTSQLLAAQNIKISLQGILNG